MVKQAPEDQLDPGRLAQYDKELRELFHGDYPSHLLVKGNRIKELRAWLGQHLGRTKPLSQMELIARAGLLIDQTTLARYENKSKEAPTLHLYAIIRAAGTTLFEIAHTPASLPPPMPATALFRAKIYIIKSWLFQTLSKDPDIDLRNYVSFQWPDAYYRDMISLTRNQEEILWHSLAQDGWVTKGKDGAFFFNQHYRPPQTQHLLFRLGKNISELVQELQFFEHIEHADLKQRVEPCKKQLASALQFAQTALHDENVELFLEALRDCDLSFSYNTDLAAKKITLHYHEDFTRWVEITIAQINEATDTDKFNLRTMLFPLFDVLGKHRESLFYLLYEKPEDVQGVLKLRQQNQVEINHVLSQWDGLRKDLADSGKLSGYKPVNQYPQTPKDD